MSESGFLKAEQVMEEMQVSRQKAYKIIRQLNEELARMGYITVQGRVKLNNRKKTFDAACRAMLFDICKRHDLHLDEEPEYGGRAYLEKQDYILMKQNAKIAIQDQQIEAKEAELKEITIRISDTEAFVEEVSDIAYEKAVAAVTSMFAA